MDLVNISNILDQVLNHESSDHPSFIRHELTDFDLETLKKACLSDEPNEKANALFALGYAHLLEKRDEEAIEPFMQAAELGNVYAMVFLGHLYQDQDEIEIAIQFYKQAIELKNPMAMLSLCELLQNLPQGHLSIVHLNIKPDIEIINLSQQLIDLGYAIGWLNLAKFYQKEGPYQNISRAIKLLKHKFLQDNPDALHQLSNIYSKGIGCKANQKKSYAYFERALLLKEEHHTLNALFSNSSQMDTYLKWKHSHADDAIESWIKNDNKKSIQCLRQATVLSDSALCDLALQLIYGSIESNGYQVDYNLSYIYYEIANLTKKGLPRPANERIYPMNDVLFIEKLSLLQNIQFDTHLNAIKKNILELFDEAKKNPSYLEPAKAALALHQTLIQATRDFMESPLTEHSKNSFHSACSNAIHQAKPILEKHPGWRNPMAILLNSVVFVLTAGTAPFVNWLMRRRANLFSPSSLVKLEEAEEALELISSFSLSESSKSYVSSNGFTNN